MSQDGSRWVKLGYWVKISLAVSSVICGQDNHISSTSAKLMKTNKVI